MSRYIQSMAAAFIATVVLSLLMLVKGTMGVMPTLNPIIMLSGMAHASMGMPTIPVVGWLAHFVLGTVVWGMVFVLLYNRLPGKNALLKGLSFSVPVWLLMMLFPLPMVGAGLFGLKIGMMAPVLTLVMHLIWGAVLGYTYGRLAIPSDSEKRAAG